MMIAFHCVRGVFLLAVLIFAYLYYNYTPGVGPTAADSL